MIAKVETIQPRYLSMKDAAIYTGLTTRTLHKAVAKELVRSFLNGRKRLVLRESLDAWIERPQSGGMPQTVTPRWLSRKAATQYCGLSKTTIDLHIREGTFQTQKAGRNRLIDREALDAWIGKGSVESEPIRLHPDDIEAIAAAVVRLMRSA